jgi:hypothetical protein
MRMKQGQRKRERRVDTTGKRTRQGLGSVLGSLSLHLLQERQQKREQRKRQR